MKVVTVCDSCGDTIEKHYYEGKIIGSWEKKLTSYCKDCYKKRVKDLRLEGIARKKTKKKKMSYLYIKSTNKKDKRCN